MILVFFLGIILAILIIVTILVVFSNIQIEIENFEISNTKTSNTRNSNVKPENTAKKYNNKYEVIISLLFLNKVKWISIHLNRLRLRKIYTKMHLERIDIKKLEQDFSFSNLKEIIKIKPNIKKLNLKIDIGLENIILTTYLIPLICTILSIILSKNVNIKDIDEIEYLVKPIYNNGNKYHIKLSSILSFRISSILKVVFRIYKKNKFKKKELTNKVNYSV